MLATPSKRPAIVSRATAQPWAPNHYLRVESEGPASWTLDPRAATAFASMKEATRAALALPSSLRAFGLPLRTELVAREELHWAPRQSAPSLTSPARR